VRPRTIKLTLERLETRDCPSAVTPGADEVSANIAALFNAWGQTYKDVSAQAAAIHEQFANTLNALTTESWVGPASGAMLSSTAPYIAWLSTTAQASEQAATQAQAAAQAFEQAFTMTVPPTVIAANRTQLANLIATNFLGQNTPAIAATEAQYTEMWAQDVTALINDVKPANLAESFIDAGADAGVSDTLILAQATTKVGGWLLDHNFDPSNPPPFPGENGISYAALPPEINSARMLAWDSLAGDLNGFIDHNP
jgi:PPE-repeat protein